MNAPDEGAPLPPSARAPRTDPELPLTASQFDELVRREEIADIKATKSREAEARARTAVLINALIGLVALIAEVLRQYSASKGHP